MPPLESNTAYMTVNTRGIPGTFHWGVFITSSAPTGRYYHATNKFGGWQLEVRQTARVMSSLTLVLAYKRGRVSSPDRTDQVLQNLPADGSPSLRTGEEFTCRIWTKDAIMALFNNRLLDLNEDIDTLERQAFIIASELEPRVEQGLSRAAIRDSASSSSSMSSSSRGR